MATDERLIYLARLKVLSEKTAAWLEGGTLDIIDAPNLSEPARRKLERKVLSRMWQDMAAEFRALTGAYNQHEDK